MITNIARLVAFPAAIVAVTFAQGIVGIAIGFISGELIALVIGLVMLRNGSQGPVGNWIFRLAVFVCASATVVGWEFVIQHPQPLPLIGISVWSVALLGYALRQEYAILVAAWGWALSRLPLASLRRDSAPM